MLLKTQKNVKPKENPNKLLVHDEKLNTSVNQIKEFREYIQ